MVHRISKQELQKPKELGGIGLPSFLHIYWAANSKAMVYWQLANNPDRQTEIPSWLAIEQSLPQKTSLKAILFSPPRPTVQPPVRESTI